MPKDLSKKLAQLGKQQSRIEGKIETLKARHARNLMNEARALLGRSPITSKRTKRVARASKAKTGKGPTFSKGTAGK